MTLIAVWTCVNIIADAIVIVVSLCFGVAIRALKDCVIRRIRMACRAYAVGIAVICREPCVIESSSLPACGGVASRAGRRETGRLMVRIGRARVIRFVTRIAIGRHGRVVVVHVAIGAGNSGVRPGQRERGVVVIEARRLPCSRVVAQIAGLRESRLHVIRTSGRIEIIQVAGRAGRIRQVVVAVDVALRALQIRMCPGQREAGGVVIECRSVP